MYPNKCQQSPHMKPIDYPVPVYEANPQFWDETFKACD